MIQLHDVEQGTDAWQELRAKLYTGSNADKLFSYSGQVKIVDGVVSAYALTEITGFGGNFFTERGHMLEDEAIDLYQQIKKNTGIRFANGHKVGFVTNSKYPSCGYSPDDLYHDRTIECKAFNEVKHMKMYGGDIPLKVLAQCYFGMIICGVKICDLIIYNPSLEAKYAFKIVTIRWNPKIAANLKRILNPMLVAA